jgi:hypothetical protein
VEIGSLGQHPASGSITTVVSVGTVFTVRAFNARGEWVERSSPEIRVVPLPRLDTIPVPEFGGLSLRFTYPPQLLGDVFGAGAEDAATSQPLPAPRLARSFAVQPLHHPDDPVARGHAAPRLTHSLAVQPLADRGDAAAMPPAAPLPSRVFGEPGPLWPIFRRHTNADEGG